MTTEHFLSSKPFKWKNGRLKNNTFRAPSVVWGTGKNFNAPSGSNVRYRRPAQSALDNLHNLSFRFW
jgi:hypothetical protein